MKRNPEKAREAMRRWRAAHREKHNAEVRAYAARNRERREAANKRYREANPEVLRTMWRTRRARKLQAGGAFSTAEWLALVAWYGGCAYCGSSGPLQADHRVPLARGGANSIDNILPACGPCNRRKHTLTEEEFRRRLTNGPTQGIQEPAAAYN